MVYLLTQVDKPVLCESCSLGLECQEGGTSDPTLHRSLKSIANKYHEGRMKRTLERELRVCEIVEGNINQIVEKLGLPSDAGFAEQHVVVSLSCLHGGSNLPYWVASEELSSLCNYDDHAAVLQSCVILNCLML